MDLSLQTALIGLISVFGLGLILVKPIVGLLFLCVLLPNEKFVATLPLYFYTLLGGAIIAGYTLSRIYPQLNKDSYLAPIDFTEYLFVFLYILWLVGTNIQSAEYLAGPMGQGRYWIFTCLQLSVVFFLASQLIHGSQIAWISLALMLGTLISASSDYQAFLAGDYFEKAYRVSGDLGDANSFAAFALAGLALLPALLAVCRSRWLRAVVLLLAALQVIIVFYSRSRTGFLALCCLFLLWLFLYQKYLKNVGNSSSIFSVLAILMVSGFLILFFVSEDYFSFMYNTILGGIFREEGTMGLRYSYWKVAIIAFKSSPIWGIGLGNFQWFTLKFPIRYGVVVHNAYLHVLAETGIVGLFLFLGWQAMALYRFWLVINTGPTLNIRLLGFSGISALLVLMFMGLTLSSQWDKLLWIIAGYSISLAAYNKHMLFSAQVSDMSLLGLNYSSPHIVTRIPYSDA